MKVLKFLNILLLIATVYQYYNFKIIYKYHVSEQKLNTEYYYKQGEITKTEFKKEIFNIKQEKERIILYRKINLFLLILNILFFIYWFIYGNIKNNVKKND